MPSMQMTMTVAVTSNMSTGCELQSAITSNAKIIIITTTLLPGLWVWEDSRDHQMSYTSL